MSNLDPRPDTVELRASVVSAVDVIEARKAAIGDGTEVRRLLPTRELRTIGAWCFLDHYGPDDVSAASGMQVPPHPHIGLQTASWLFDGLVLHRDSLGSEQLIRPGELNLMTSGRAIAHSEESPPQRPPLLHGVQLWIALPQERRFGDPDFAHHADLPVLDTADGARITVVAGEFGGERSPATVYTPLVGLEVVLPGASQVTLPATDGYEYGVLTADGPVRVGIGRSDHRPLRAPDTVAGSAIGRASGGYGGSSPRETGAGRAPDTMAGSAIGRSASGGYGGSSPREIAVGELAHLPAGVPSITLSSAGPCRLFVVGGEPLREKLVMWWNFVARTHEEIVTVRNAWGNGEFGEVRGYAGDPLAAPPLPPGELKARGNRSLDVSPGELRADENRSYDSRLRSVVSAIGSNGGRIASNLCFWQLCSPSLLTGPGLAGYGGSPFDRRSTRIRGITSRAAMGIDGGIGALSSPRRGQMAPTIGITTYHMHANWRGWSEEGALLPWTYVTSIRNNGGRPVLLPPGGDVSEAEATVAVLDGIVIAGGGDINPAIYGAPKHPKTEDNAPDRDSWELALAEAAVRQGVPLLGICRGHQMLNVACGGTLHQHVPDLVGHGHHSGPDNGFGTHKVRVTSGTILSSILPGGEFFEVPTHHHQAVDIVGSGLTAVAWADDGIVEGIESTTPGEFLVGVQWHPEQGDDPRLFSGLIAAAEMHYSERTVASSLPPLLAGA